MEIFEGIGNRGGEIIVDKGFVEQIMEISRVGVLNVVELWICMINQGFRFDFCELFHICLEKLPFSRDLADSIVENDVNIMNFITEDDINTLFSINEFGLINNLSNRRVLNDNICVWIKRNLKMIDLEAFDSTLFSIWLNVSHKSDDIQQIVDFSLRKLGSIDEHHGISQHLDVLSQCIHLTNDINLSCLSNSIIGLLSSLDHEVITSTLRFIESAITELFGSSDINDSLIDTMFSFCENQPMNIYMTSIMTLVEISKICENTTLDYMVEKGCCGLFVDFLECSTNEQTYEVFLSLLRISQECDNSNLFEYESNIQIYCSDNNVIVSKIASSILNSLQFVE